MPCAYCGRPTTKDPGPGQLKHLPRIHATVAPPSTNCSSAYTLSGKPANTTDPNGNVTRFAYEAADRLASVTDPLFRQTIYGYDALDRRMSVSNPAIQATEGRPGACAVETVAFVRGAVLGTARSKDEAFAVVEILVVGVGDGDGLRTVEPKVYFMLDQIDERAA